jgi:hypothetical protein
MEIILVSSKEDLIKHSEFISSLDLKPGENEYLKLFRVVDNSKDDNFKES